MIERTEDLLVRRQNVIDLGVADRTLRRAVDSGRMVRVLSHHAAAALWGIRMLRTWPKTVDITLEPSSTLPYGFHSRMQWSPWIPHFTASIGESDGRSKYTDPALRNGRTAEEVVIAERNRENRLRRLVKTLSRWEPADLYPASKLFRILTDAGLPSSGARLSR